MADVISLFREVMALTSNVGALRSDLEKLYTKVENTTERLIRLEAREEALTERMTNSAIKAVFDMNLQVFDRIVSLEHRVGINHEKRDDQAGVKKLESSPAE